MKYYISYVENTEDHETMFPLNEDNHRITPYLLVASRAYVMDGEVRSTTDRSSVALIAVHDEYEAVEGQTLYTLNEIELCKSEHPTINYNMLGHAWNNGILLP